MIQDYEITRTTTLFEKLLPYIEFVLVLIMIQSILTLFTSPQAEVEAETIRFRLLAHSNAPVDQRVKMEIQQEIAPLIEQAVASSTSKAELESNLVAIENDIVAKATSMAKGKNITLERKEALFPPKRSGLVIHPQAKYDAYILTIGSGRGDNWWCSLFPKVCFPDKKKDEEEKVKFFVWEWIKGVFS